MPSGNSVWVTSLPGSGSPESHADEVKYTISRKPPMGQAIHVQVPVFKTGTLNDLLKLSEYLAKHDSVVVGTVNKIAETIATFAKRDDPDMDVESKLVMDNGQSYKDYIFDTDHPWAWNERKYRSDLSTLTEVATNILHDVNDIETSQKAKVQAYQNLKNQLQSAQRRKTGNLSNKALDDVVNEDDFKDTKDSEYLTTVLLAVPKNMIKEFEASYEKYADFVVPRSAKKLAADSDYVLYSVVVFKKFKNDFVQKCRDSKIIVRDYSHNAEEVSKAKAELESLEEEEHDAIIELQQLSQINFSDAIQALVHLKVVRAYVESILQYGLPTEYLFLFIKPEPKSVDQLVQTLSDNFTEPHVNKAAGHKNSKGSGTGADDVITGEFASVMEQEFLGFVVEEIDPVKY